MQCDGPQNTQIAIQVKWFLVPNAKIWIFTKSNAFEESMKSPFSQRYDNITSNETFRSQNIQTGGKIYEFNLIKHVNSVGLCQINIKICYLVTDSDEKLSY